MYAVSGVLAAAAGMAVGHLVAAFVNPAASPVLAVGSTVIDATPTPVKEWAVQNFGTADKPILLGSVTLVVVLAAAAIGLVSRTKPSLANILVVAPGRAGRTGRVVPPRLGPVRHRARLRDGDRRCRHDHRPARPHPEPAHPGCRDDLLRSRGHHERHGARVAAGPHGIREGVGRHAAATQLPPRRRRRHRRRRRARHARARSSPPRRPTRRRSPCPSRRTRSRRCPRASRARSRASAAFSTPIKEFYRVDTALVIPRIDVDNWKLEIDGKVDNKLTHHLRRAAQDADDREGHHPQLRQQRGRRPLHLLDPLARRAGPRPARAGRRPGRRRPDPQRVHRRHDDLDPDRGADRRPRRAHRRGDERRAAARPARVPGAHGDPGPLRLRGRHQVADQADRDDVCRGPGLLDQARLVDRRHRQDPGADRHARGPRDPAGRQDRDRWRGLGPAPRHQGGRGAGRRRPVAEGHPRPRRRAPTTGGSGSGSGTPRPAGTT